MVSARFKPAEDITAYDLAQYAGLIHALRRVWFTDEQWATMSPELKRYFQVETDVRNQVT